MSPSTSVIFSPEVDDRQLDREVDQVNEAFAETGQIDVQADTPELGTPEVGGGDGGVGLGGAAASTGILASMSGGIKGLASKIPAAVGAVSASAALPVALAGAVGLGITKALAGTSAQLSSVGSMFGTAVDIFFRPFGDFLGTLLRPMASAMLDFAVYFDSTVGPALEGLGEFLTGGIGSLANWVGSGLGGLGDWVTSGLGGLSEWVTSGLGGLGSWVTSGLGSLADWVSSGLGGLGDWVSGDLGDLGHWVSGGLDLANWVASGIGGLGEWVASGLGGLGEWVTSGLGGLGDWVTSGLGGLGDWVTSGLGSLADWVGSGIGDLTDWLVDWSWNPLKSMVGWTWNPLDFIAKQTGKVADLAIPEGGANTDIQQTGKFTSGVYTGDPEDLEVESGQTGGFISRGGLIRAHSGERLMPAGQISDRGRVEVETEGIGQEITQALEATNGGGNSKALADKLDDVNRNLKQLMRAFNVTLNVDGETLARTSENNRQEGLLDTDPTTG